MKRLICWNGWFVVVVPSQSIISWLLETYRRIRKCFRNQKGRRKLLQEMLIVQSIEQRASYNHHQNLKWNTLLLQQVLTWLLLVIFSKFCLLQDLNSKAAFELLEISPQCLGAWRIQSGRSHSQSIEWALSFSNETT